MQYESERMKYTSKKVRIFSGIEKSGNESIMETKEKGAFPTKAIAKAAKTLLCWSRRNENDQH